MVQILVVLVMATPEDLSQTAEWKALAKVLASKKCWRVTLLGQGDAVKVIQPEFGRGFSIMRRSDGFLILHKQMTVIRWDGKKGIQEDLDKKTWRPINKLRDEEDPMPSIAIPGLGGGSWGRMRATTRSGYKDSNGETGWDIARSGRDYAFRDSYWFDRKTHLITEFSSQAWGMVSNGGVFKTYAMWWEFDDKLKDVEWSLTPSKGFKRFDEDR